MPGTYIRPPLHGACIRKPANAGQAVAQGACLGYCWVCPPVYGTRTRRTAAAENVTHASTASRQAVQQTACSLQDGVEEDTSTCAVLAVNI